MPVGFSSAAFTAVPRGKTTVLAVAVELAGALVVLADEESTTLALDENGNLNSGNLLAVLDVLSACTSTAVCGAVVATAVADLLAAAS
jgi:hypothetical protein